MDDDDLDPSRGLALGCLVGALLWVGIFLIAWFLMPGPWSGLCSRYGVESSRHPLRHPGGDGLADRG